jgi:hypothetical protein
VSEARRQRLEGAVVALVAEFMGTVTGTRPPLERTLFPPEMEPALKRLVDGLIKLLHDYEGTG